MDTAKNEDRAHDGIKQTKNKCVTQHSQQAFIFLWEVHTFF